MHHLIEVKIKQVGRLALPTMLEHFLLSTVGVVAISSLVVSLYMVIGGILRAMGDAKSPLKAGRWLNAIHLVLDYTFIFWISDNTKHGY